MKKLLIFFFVSISLLTTAQEKFKLYTELSQGISYYLIDWNFYSETDANVGVSLNTSKGNFTLYAKYRFGGYIVPGDFPPYTLRYSSFGGGFNYRILNQSNRISPFVRIEMVTQVKENKNEPSAFYMSEGVHPTNSSNLQSNPRYLYTSVIGNIYVGADFKVAKNFNINIGLGGSFRELKLGYNYSTTVKHLYGLSMQLGLTYAFSVKKKA